MIRLFSQPSFHSITNYLCVWSLPNACTTCIISPLPHMVANARFGDIAFFLACPMDNAREENLFQRRTSSKEWKYKYSLRQSTDLGPNPINCSQIPISPAWRIPTFETAIHLIWLLQRRMLLTVEQVLWKQVTCGCMTGKIHLAGIQAA